MLEVMIDRRPLPLRRVAFPTPVTKRPSIVATGLHPCPMPARQHLPGRIPQLVDHRRRAAIVLLIQPHRTKPLLPRVPQSQNADLTKYTAPERSRAHPAFVLRVAGEQPVDEAAHVVRAPVIGARPARPAATILAPPSGPSRAGPAVPLHLPAAPRGTLAVPCHHENGTFERLSTHTAAGTSRDTGHTFWPGAKVAAHTFEPTKTPDGTTARAQSRTHFLAYNSWNLDGLWK